MSLHVGKPFDPLVFVYVGGCPGSLGILVIMVKTRVGVL